MDTAVRTLKLLQWNIRSLPLRKLDLLYYIANENPDVICLQEPFPAHSKDKLVPPITGYIPHFTPNGNGLVTYVHHSIPHTLIRSSTDLDNQYQLFRLPVNNGHLYICNTYIRGNKFRHTVLPTPQDKSIFYVGDFNARHPQLGDTRGRTTVNGTRLLNFVTTFDLNVQLPAHPTHFQGGYLDYSINSGVIPHNVEVATVDELSSDHFALLTTYTLPADSHTPHNRPRISIPSKYSGIFIDELSRWYSTYSPQDVSSFYADLVNFTTTFHNYYVLKTHRRRKNTATKRTTWALDDRLEAESIRLNQLAERSQQTGSPDDLLNYINAVSTFRELKGSVRREHWEGFLQEINSHTSTSEVWDRIRRLTGMKAQTQLHHCPDYYANEFVQQWSSQSHPSSLPADVRQYLSATHIDRQFTIEIAASEIGITDDIPISEDELRSALSQGRATCPGDDGITYSVLRLISQAQGNPLLRLYNMSLATGTLPAAWTSSTIIPIPKPNSTKHRPISLTSCFCKVMERALLNRVQYLIGDQLSSHLYGFLPGRSTQHCFAEYLSVGHPYSCVAFIDLKSAFDIANRDIILEELAGLGVRGQLFQWIRGYLSNRKSRVLFKGALSETKEFTLGTPQGGVLSPTLFNVLMHRLIKQIALNDQESILSYADDICIIAHSPARLQELLNDFAHSALRCGLLISTDKTRIQINSSLPHPSFRINNHVIPECRQYMYLGVSTNTVAHASTMAGYVTDLVARLRQRLKPLQYLTGKKVGVAVPIARSFYLQFIRSVIDYHALHLCNLPEHLLLRLDKVQNEAMRLILGCPLTTRVVNMQTELRIPPIPDRIRTLTATFAVKCIKRPHLAPHFTELLHQQLQHQQTPEQSPPNLPHHSRLLFQTVGKLLAGFSVPFTEAPSTPAPSPWEVAPASITYAQVPTTGHQPPYVLKHFVLEAIASVLTTLPVESLVAYTDGSLQQNGSAGSGCLIYRGQDCIYSVSDKLSNWTSTTRSELAGIQRGVEYLAANREHGLIICDSKSALQSLTSSHPQYADPVNSIKQSLVTARNLSIIIKFLWIPAHVGHPQHDAVDQLAKLACHKPGTHVDTQVGLSTSIVRRVLRQRSVDDLAEERNYQRFSSVSIHHYDLFCNTPHRYGQHKVLTRQCDVVSARIRLGYRYLWQLQTSPPEDLTKCKLCDAPRSHTLEHYIADCPKVAAFRPAGVGYFEFCQILLNTDLLETILIALPLFAYP